MIPARFATDAREVVLRSAVVEAERRGDRYLGTEHLLLGLLADPAGIGVEAIGVDLGAARDALHQLDGQALDAIGIDPNLAVSDGGGARRRRPPLTDGAKQALRRAIEGSIGSGDRRVTARHLLVGIVAAAPPDPAALVLRALGCDADAIRESLGAAGTDQS